MSNNSLSDFLAQDTVQLAIAIFVVLVVIVTIILISSIKSKKRKIDLSKTQKIYRDQFELASKQRLEHTTTLSRELLMKEENKTQEELDKTARINIEAIRKKADLEERLGITSKIVDQKALPEASKKEPDYNQSVTVDDVKVGSPTDSAFVEEVVDFNNLDNYSVENQENIFDVSSIEVKEENHGLFRNSQIIKDSAFIGGAVELEKDKLTDDDLPMYSKEPAEDLFNLENSNNTVISKNNTDSESNLLFDENNDLFDDTEVTNDLFEETNISSDLDEEDVSSDAKSLSYSEEKSIQEVESGFEDEEGNDNYAFLPPINSVDDLIITSEIANFEKRTNKYAFLDNEDFDISNDLNEQFSNSLETTQEVEDEFLTELNEVLEESNNEVLDIDQYENSIENISEEDLNIFTKSSKVNSSLTSINFDTSVLDEASSIEEEVDVFEDDPTNDSITFIPNTLEEDFEVVDEVPTNMTFGREYFKDVNDVVEEQIQTAKVKINSNMVYVEPTRKIVVETPVYKDDTKINVESDTEESTESIIVEENNLSAVDDIFESVLVERSAIDVESQIEKLNSYDDMNFDLIDNDYSYNYNKINVMDEIINDMHLDNGIDTSSHLMNKDESIRFVYQYALLADKINEYKKDVVEPTIDNTVVDESKYNFNELISNVKVNSKTRKYNDVEKEFASSEFDYEGKEIDDELLNLSSLVISHNKNDIEENNEVLDIIEFEDETVIENENANLDRDIDEMLSHYEINPTEENLNFDKNLIDDSLGKKLEIDEDVDFLQVLKDFSK